MGAGLFHRPNPPGSAGEHAQALAKEETAKLQLGHLQKQWENKAQELPTRTPRPP